MAPGESYNGLYPAVADSVPSARVAVTRFAHQAGATVDRLEAIRLAVSEAVTNAVQHAYRGSAGPILVSASYVPDGLWVLISDNGSGLRARADSPGLGLGLALISELADDFEIHSRSTGGTEVRMRFCLRSRKAPGSSQLRGSRAAAAAPA